MKRTVANRRGSRFNNPDILKYPGVYGTVNNFFGFSTYFLRISHELHVPFFNAANEINDHVPFCRCVP